MFLNIFLFLAILILSIQTVISEYIRASENVTANEFAVENEGSRVLSRRKRYLTFPDGSSLQLVFLIQTPLLIPIGDIFLYGTTAGLAWTLPSEPQFGDLLKYKDKALRREDAKSITYVDEKGKIVAKVPYKRRIIANPAFAKRSIDNKMSSKDNANFEIDRIKMHKKQATRDYLKTEHLDKKSIEFHRNNRVEFFGKLEKLLTAVGRDGRQCVLYKLCESAQSSPKQDAFLQEFLRAVFTLPKGSEFEEEYHKEYDKAHTIADDCLSLYPGCEF